MLLLCCCNKKTVFITISDLINNILCKVFAGTGVSFSSYSFSAVVDCYHLLVSRSLACEASPR